MPVYDYKCSSHGLFHDLATVDESSNPRLCPACGVLSGRVIMLAPEFQAMKADNRAAHARNEKAMHEPVFSTPDYRAEQAARRAHRRSKGASKGSSKDCSCGDKPIRKSALFFTADGNKMFPSMRPWMISH